MGRTFRDFVRCLAQRLTTLAIALLLTRVANAQSTGGSFGGGDFGSGGGGGGGGGGGVGGGLEIAGNLEGLGFAAVVGIVLLLLVGWWFRDLIHSITVGLTGRKKSCVACGEVAKPKKGVCPSCGGEMEKIV